MYTFFGKLISLVFLVALHGRNAQTVCDSSSSQKIDNVMAIKTFLNPEGHHNPIIGSKFMVILLKGPILPIGGGSGINGATPSSF